MIRLELKTAEIDKAFRGIKSGIRNPRPAFNKIAEYEVGEAKNRIRTTKVDPEGKPWKAWSYTTMMQRSKFGPSRGLLYRSGALLRSFDFKVTNSKVTITNTKSYAPYLQEGTDNMPARPFLGWGKDSDKNATSAFIEYFKRKMK